MEELCSDVIFGGALESMNRLAVITVAIICASLLAGLPNSSLAQNTEIIADANLQVPIQFATNIHATQTLTPTEATPKLVAYAAINTATYWKDLAQNAWTYFQPGNSFNSATGLHYAALYYPYFTDWDLGVYIQAIIDADKLGLANAVGWDTNSRLNKVLTFLENRPLMPNGQPYAWYSAETGLNTKPDRQVAWDAGNLLAVLKNVEAYKPTLKTRIDNIVYSRTNYEPLAKEANSANRIHAYDYYLASGFAAFWPNNIVWPSKLTTSFTSQANTILNNIVNAPTIQTYGVTLPKADLVSEPLLLSIFNLPYQDPKLLDLARKVYLAQEAKSNANGKYVAYSEGNTGGVITGPADGEYVYEFVVQSSGRTWVLQNTNFAEIAISPITYLKTAASFSAIYNTKYAQDMTNYLLSQIHPPSKGYEDGIDQDGRINTAVTDKTNSMIISAARYAITNIAVPNPTPTPSPPQTPTPTAAPTPNPTTTPTPTQNPSPSPTTTPNPSTTPSPSPTPIQTPTPSNTETPPSTNNPSSSPIPTDTPNSSRPTTSPSTTTLQTPNPSNTNAPQPTTPANTSPIPNQTPSSNTESPTFPNQSTNSPPPTSNPPISPNPSNPFTTTLDTTPANNPKKSSTTNPETIAVAAIAVVAAICILGTIKLKTKKSKKQKF